MYLKKQLRFYLDRREMSAAQLAKKASVPKQSLSGWLAGSNPRDVRQVKRVAEVLGVSVDHLLFGDGEDQNAMKVTELDALLGDEWISGLFEVKFRRVRK
jgi:transcriptional regulator with XRE-family HTH domain